MSTPKIAAAIQITLLLVVLPSCYAKFTYCKLHDPDFDTCLSGSIEDAIHSLATDYAEYDMEPLDPLSVNQFTLDAGTGPVNLVQYYENVQIKGLSQAKINKAHYDEDKKKMFISVTIPKITMLTDYHVKGSLMALPVYGRGKSSIIFENVQFDMDIAFDTVEKGGHTYLKIISVDVDIKPSRMRMNFENLFDGNKLLGDNINKVINEEWQALFSDVKASIEKNYAREFMRYAQKYFDKVPVDEIFLL